MLFVDDDLSIQVYNFPILLDLQNYHLESVFLKFCLTKYAELAGLARNFRCFLISDFFDFKPTIFGFKIDSFMPFTGYMMRIR